MPATHDDGVGGGDAVEVGEQPVQAGDADVVDASASMPLARERERALVGHRNVGRAGGDDERHGRSSRAAGSRHSSATARGSTPGRVGGDAP